jgi:hypothetical protein
VKTGDAVGSLVEVIKEVTNGLPRGFDGDLVFKSQGDNPLSLTLSPEGRGDLDCPQRLHSELLFSESHGWRTLSVALPGG